MKPILGVYYSHSRRGHLRGDFSRAFVGRGTVAQGVLSAGDTAEPHIEWLRGIRLLASQPSADYAWRTFAGVFMEVDRVGSGAPGAMPGC